VSAKTIIEPYTYYEDFESGSVGPWSSYPPAQDTAYDPTIWVKHTDKDSGNRALFREITPNYEIDYVFGMRKKLDLFVDRSSNLSFKCSVKSNRDIEGIRIRFSFGDGIMVEKVMLYKNLLSWTELRVPMAEIISENTPRQLTGIAFMAVCPKADPENLLRFGIDDVKLECKRPVQWHFLKPEVHKLEEWSDFIAASHFREGEKITFECEAPFKTRAVAIQIQRVFTNEKGGIYPLKPTPGGGWNLEIPLDSRSGITPGLWRAHILSSTHNGDTISSSLVFLVKPKKEPSGHPRLFMTAEEKSTLLSRVSSGHLKEIWDYLQKDAQKKRETIKIEDFN
jgi:hypothetical protein